MGIMWKTKEITVRVPAWHRQVDYSTIDDEKACRRGAKPSEGGDLPQNVPAWRSWFQRDVIGYFILGMLVCGSWLEILILYINTGYRYHCPR